MRVFLYRCSAGHEEETDRPLGDTLEFCRACCQVGEGPAWHCEETPRRVWQAAFRMSNLKEARR